MPDTTTVTSDVTEPQQPVADAKVPLDVEDSAGPLTPDESVEPHALEPGGDRFKQVWARAKSAEEREKRLEGELQHEREERIRYEERLKAQEAATSTKHEPVYTRAQLEEFIANGQLTRAQAEDYNEARVRREVVEESEKRLDAKLAAARRIERVQADLDRYKTLMPTIMQPGTAERDKVAAEYRHITDTLGVPKSEAERLAMELTASRAAFGDLGALERSHAAASATRDNREITVETTSAGKGTPNTKDPLASLTPREKEHYDRMIKKGRYKGGWADVRAELTWVRGQKQA